MLINHSHTELVAITFSLVNVSVSEDIKFFLISAPQLPHAITETPPSNAPSQKELGVHLGTLSCLCCSCTLPYPIAEYKWGKNIGTDLIFSLINLMPFWAKWWKELLSGKQRAKRRKILLWCLPELVSTHQLHWVFIWESQGSPWKPATGAQILVILSQDK